MASVNQAGVEIHEFAYGQTIGEPSDALQVGRMCSDALAIVKRRIYIELDLSRELGAQKK